MNIIDNVSPKKPKFIYDKWAKDLPGINASQLEKDKFVERELNRWVTGHGGLTGRHYAYCTQGNLKTVTGKIIKPRWRDIDEFIFQEGDEARRLGEDELIIKRREVGLSSVYGGFEPMYNALVNAGSTSLLTSADKPRVQSLFSEKVVPMYANLDEGFKPARISNKMTGYLHLGNKDKDGTISGVDSKILCIETASSDSNAKAFENYRAMYIFIDEIFLNKRAPIVHKSSQACLKQGFSKVGHLVIGGSAGAETKEEADLLKQGALMGEALWNNAKTLRIRTLFLPGQMGIESAPEMDEYGNPTGKTLNFCINGHSDQKAALEWIEKERDRLEKGQDKDFYYNFIKNYPINIDEVFEINRAAVFPKEVYDKLNRAKKDFYIEGQPVGNFNLFRRNGMIVREPDKKGKFYIYGEPRQNEEYIAGIDPNPFGNSNVNDGSDLLIAIKARTTEQYVAYYAERSMDADIVIENCVMLQEYYKSNLSPQGAIAMIESNRAEVALRVYEEKGKNHLLANKPTHLGIAYEDKKQKKGYFSNDKTISRGNSFMAEFLKDHAENIRFLRLITELQRWPVGNADFVDAMRACEILDAELVVKGRNRWIPPATRKQSYLTRDSQGRTVTKWKDVPIR